MITSLKFEGRRPVQAMIHIVLDSGMQVAIGVPESVELAFKILKNGKKDKTDIELIGTQAALQGSEYVEETNYDLFCISGSNIIMFSVSPFVAQNIIRPKPSRMM